MTTSPRRYALPFVLAVALALAALALRGRERLPETPEAAVSALFDAAERGDVPAYLTLLDIELRRSIERVRDEIGRDRLAQDLRGSVLGIKGLAVSRAREEASGKVLLEAELVFAERSERQRMRLRPERGGWIIESMESAERSQQAVPYGTPVFPQ